MSKQQGKKPEIPTKFTASQLREKAAIIREIAKDFDEVADAIEKLPSKSALLKFESTLTRGIGFVLNWVSNARATTRRMAFDATGRTETVDADAEKLTKHGKKSKPSE